LELETAFAVIAGVLLVAALAAGLVERAPLSFPMLFLGLGFLIGDRGLGLISIGLDNDVLEVVAVLTLALVLFLDAVNLELIELRRDWLPPFLVLGPATLLVAGLLAGAGMLLLDLPVVLALLLGTILASTDPVVLHDVVRDARIPPATSRGSPRTSSPSAWPGRTPRWCWMSAAARSTNATASASPAVSGSFPTRSARGRPTASAISRSCCTAPDRGSRPAPGRRWSFAGWASRPRRGGRPERLASRSSRGADHRCRVTGAGVEAEPTGSSRRAAWPSRL
jgi:hypothetical protein